MLTNPKQYSQHWKKESEFLDSHGIYERLSKKIVGGNILEVGCGVGKGTRHLSIGRNVLSLDSNSYLIDEAKTYLDGVGVKHRIHMCDLFNLADEDKIIIKEFEPEVIVGWFIGSHGADIFARTDEEPDMMEKPKLYREKIEDIIISRDICLDTVEYINLANRGGRIAGFSDAELFDSVKDDYDAYVFNNIGFEVCDVTNMDWPREGSDFYYGQAANPNLAKGESIPTITSIIAKRIR